MTLARETVKPTLTSPNRPATGISTPSIARAPDKQDPRRDFPRTQKARLLTGLFACMTGVADGTRTHDDRNHNPGLYQLSYSHHCPRLPIDWTGFRGKTRLYKCFSRVASPLGHLLHFFTAIPRQAPKHGGVRLHPASAGAHGHPRTAPQRRRACGLASDVPFPTIRAATREHRLPHGTGPAYGA
jgi:hypothetical protein